MKQGDQHAQLARDCPGTPPTLLGKLRRWDIGGGWRRQGKINSAGEYAKGSGVFILLITLFVCFSLYHSTQKFPGLFVLAYTTAHRSSQARDRTPATAVTRATAVTMLCP